MLAAAIIVGIVLGVYFGIYYDRGDDEPISRGAVVANGFECAQIGA